MEDKIKKIEIIKYDHNSYKRLLDDIVIENRYKLFLNGNHIHNFLCLNSNLEELAVGYLINERHILWESHINSLDIDYNNGIIRVITKTFRSNNKTEEKKVVNTSVKIRITPTEIIDICSDFSKKTFELFNKTGSIHASAIYINTEMIALMQDIGRHNTIDKLTGWMKNNNQKINNKIIVTTARVTESMARKLINIMPCIVLSRAATTTMAVNTLSRYGVTLIGFCRDNRFNIYFDQNRIIL